MSDDSDGAFPLSVYAQFKEFCARQQKLRSDGRECSENGAVKLDTARALRNMSRSLHQPRRWDTELRPCRAFRRSVRPSPRSPRTIGPTIRTHAPGQSLANLPIPTGPPTSRAPTASATETAAPGQMGGHSRGRRQGRPPLVVVDIVPASFVGCFAPAPRHGSKALGPRGPDAGPGRPIRYE